jgi:hypothetical protein
MMHRTEWWERLLACVLVAPMCIGMLVLVAFALVALALIGPFLVLFMDDPLGRNKKNGIA